MPDRLPPFFRETGIDWKATLTREEASGAVALQARSLDDRPFQVALLKIQEPSSGFERWCIHIAAQGAGTGLLLVGGHASYPDSQVSATAVFNRLLRMSDEEFGWIIDLNQDSSGAPVTLMG